MNDIIILQDDDLDILFNRINCEQILFHPRYAKIGEFNVKNIFELKSKNVIVILDRNISLRLFEYTTNGNLKNENLMETIATLMLWCNYNHFSLNFGLAMNEAAQHVGNIETNIELKHHFTIGEQFLSMDWKKVLSSDDKTIPIFPLQNEIDNLFDYESKNLHQQMSVSVMLAIIRIEATKNTMEEKICSFIEWYYDSGLLIGQYNLVYAFLLFSGYQNVKFPKNSKSSNFEKIINGCNNQAWDLAYLSFWSTLYWNDNQSNDIYFFATMDNLLKLILIVTHTIDNLGLLPRKFFSPSIAVKIEEIISKKVQNRKSIDELKLELTNEKIQEIRIVEENNLKDVLNIL